MKSSICSPFVSVQSTMIQEFMSTWLCKWFFSACSNRKLNRWFSISSCLVDTDDRFFQWRAFISCENQRRHQICVLFRILSFSLFTCWIICLILNAVFQTFCLLFRLTAGPGWELPSHQGLVPSRSRSWLGMGPGASIPQRFDLILSYEKNFRPIS